MNVFLTAVFEETKENKLEYTELFQNYTKLIENNLEDMLKSKLPVRFHHVHCILLLLLAISIKGFNMDKLERLLVDRKGLLSRINTLVT